MVDPEQVNRVWQKLLLEAGVKIHFYCTVIDVTKENNQAKGIELFCRGKHHTLLSKCLIDATGNADAATLAGCQWIRVYEPDIFTQEVSLVFSKRVEKGAGNAVNKPEYISRKNRKQVDTLSIKNLTQATIDMRQEIWEETPQDQLVTTAAELGVRSSRIPNGMTTVSNDNTWNLKKSSASIAKCSWELDVHPTDSQPVDPHLFHSKSDIYAERLQKLADGDWFDIPFGAIIAADIDNLLFAGRIVSAELFAHGSLRIQQTCMATGEAAGITASISANTDISAQKLKAEDVVKQLANHRDNIQHCPDIDRSL